ERCEILWHAMATGEITPDQAATACRLINTERQSADFEAKVRAAVAAELRAELEATLRAELTQKIRAEVIAEIRAEITAGRASLNSSCIPGRDAAPAPTSPRDPPPPGAARWAPPSPAARARGKVVAPRGHTCPSPAPAREGGTRAATAAWEGEGPEFAL